MKKHLLATAIVTSALTSIANANIKADIESIKVEYRPKIEMLKQKAHDIKEDIPSDEELMVGVKLKTGWELQEFKLDIPEFVMKPHRWVLHLPQSKMNTQRWVFHLPEVYWGITSGPLGIGKLHLPQIRMKKHEVKLDVPEFTFEPVEMKLHIPEVLMQTQTWKMHLPTFAVQDTNVQVNQMKKQSIYIGNQIKSLTSEMVSKINAKVRENLISKKMEVSRQFEESIKGLETTINAWSDNPKVDTSGMLESLTRLKAERLKTLAKLDAEIAKLG